MKMKTSELSGMALDWAVATCEDVGDWGFLQFYEGDEDEPPEWHYSTDWALGGVIIEREGISVALERGEPWAAWSKAAFRDDAEAFGYGETPLVAAMRCYVASKLGDEVEVPEEVCNGQG